MNKKLMTLLAAVAVVALSLVSTYEVNAQGQNNSNQFWWPDLFPFVDALNSMGYQHIGASAPEWRAYAAQKAAAGPNAAKLLIGVPGAKPDWLGNTVAEHLDWIAHDNEVGLTIWDARFTDPYWQTPEAWKTLTKIRHGQ